jgi:hypothetical protein
MRYQEIQTGKLLAPFIECFWTLEGEPDSGREHSRTNSS